MLNNLSLVWIRESLSHVLAAESMYAFCAFLSYIASIFLYALRWAIVLKNRRIPYKFYDVIASYYISILVNNLTPSTRAGGEFIRVAYIHIKSRARILDLVNTIAFERITEAVPVVGITIIAIGLGIIAGGKIYTLAAGLLVIIILSILSMKYWDKLMDYIIKRLEKRIPREKLQQPSFKLKDLLGNRYLTVTAIAISTLVWILDLARIYLVALSVGVTLSIPVLLSVTVSYILLGVFSITPGGLGIVEGGLTGILVALGIDPSRALAITIIERTITFLVASGISLIVLGLAGGSKLWRNLKQI